LESEFFGYRKGAFTGAEKDRQGFFDAVAAGRTPADDMPEADIVLRDAMQHFEKKYISSILDRHQWNRTKVAGILGIERKTLYLKMKRLGIRVGYAGDGA
jgi:transcriptional regulator with PAS, ATPase and Fis domain